MSEPEDEVVELPEIDSLIEAWAHRETLWPLLGQAVKNTVFVAVVVILATMQHLRVLEVMLLAVIIACIEFRTEMNALIAKEQKRVLEILSRRQKILMQTAMIVTKIVKEVNDGDEEGARPAGPDQEAAPRGGDDDLVPPEDAGEG